MTLGNAVAARVRLIVWYKGCQHQVEPDPAEMAERYGAATTVLDWSERLVCSRCGSRRVDMVARVKCARCPSPTEGGPMVPNASHCPPVHGRGP